MMAFLMTFKITDVKIYSKRDILHRPRAILSGKEQPFAHDRYLGCYN